MTNPKIKLVTQYAFQLVGIPYKYTGNVPQDGGLDCSGFCLHLLRAFRLWNTTDASCQMIMDKYKTVKLYKEAELEEGDFIFFGKDKSHITHIAYYVGEGMMLEAGGDDKTGMVRLMDVRWRKDAFAVLRTSSLLS